MRQKNKTKEEIVFHNRQQTDICSLTQASLLAGRNSTPSAMRNTPHIMSCLRPPLIHYWYSSVGNRVRAFCFVLQLQHFASHYFDVGVQWEGIQNKSSEVLMPWSTVRQSFLLHRLQYQITRSKTWHFSFPPASEASCGHSDSSLLHGHTLQVYIHLLTCHATINYVKHIFPMATSNKKTKPYCGYQSAHTKWNHIEGRCYLPSVTACLYRPGLPLSPSVWEAARTWGGKLTRVNCAPTQHYLGRQGATGAWLNLQPWRQYRAISRLWGLWKIAPGHFLLSTNPYLSSPQTLSVVYIILSFIVFFLISASWKLQLIHLIF